MSYSTKEDVYAILQPFRDSFKETFDKDLTLAELRSSLEQIIEDKRAQRIDDNFRTKTPEQLLFILDTVNDLIKSEGKPNKMKQFFDNENSSQLGNKKC